MIGKTAKVAFILLLLVDERFEQHCLAGKVKFHDSAIPVSSIDLFLLHQLGHDALTLYDGSMGEWARDPSLPIETD